MKEPLASATIANWRSSWTWDRFSRLLRLSERFLGRALLVLVVTAGATFFFIPFAWMLSTSVKPGSQVYAFPPIWIPKPFVWRHYIEPLTGVGSVGRDESFLRFPLYYKNTMFLEIANVTGTVASSALVAYGFARLRFRGRGLLLLLVLSTMMLPSQVTLIPKYILFSKLKWINTFKPLIIPCYGGSAIMIFLLRQYFMTIHPELDDAARMDGCSLLGIFWRIILPLSKPALGVVAIWEFTWQWNAFMEPLIYLQAREKFTISVGLMMVSGVGSRRGLMIQPLMAMTVLSVLPVILVFFLAQRYFIQGIVLTGVKG